VTKGDTILNSNYSLIDSLSDASQTDFTLFVGDIRVLTTLTTSDGIRLTGTQANQTITSEVMNQKQPRFYKNVDLFQEKYLAYYAPLYNSNGDCVGMFAAVMPAHEVDVLIYKTVLPIVLLTIVAGILAIFWSFYFSKGFIKVIQKLSNSFRQIAEGTLSNTVEPELLARKDEFGDMAHSVIDMQSALRKLVNEDALTGLANRRSGQKRLDQLTEHSLESGQPFCLALGDIDFFKKFNDTYGHDCGDLVLKEVSRIMKSETKNYGTCVRWGGEEFLIIFSRGTVEELTALMEHMMQSIRDNVITYKDQQLSVTMTFGFIETSGLTTSDEMVKKVDELLYYGKEHGRNQLTRGGTFPLGGNVPL